MNDAGLRSSAPSPGARPQAINAGSGIARRFIHVAVGNRHVEVLVAAVALSEMLGDGDRAMATAGAADGDDEVRLALGHVLREQEVEQLVQALVERGEAAVPRDVVDYALVEPRQLPQLGLVVRVVQEA